MSAAIHYQRPPTLDQLNRSSSNAKYPRPFSDHRYSQEKRTLTQLFVQTLGVLPPDPIKQKIPVHKGKVPIFDEFSQALRICPFAFLPLGIRELYHYVFDTYPSPTEMWLILSLNAFTFGVLFVNFLNHLVLKYGYFDGEVYRDTVPNKDLYKMLFEVLCGASLRPLLAVAFSYDQNKPTQLSLWLPVELLMFTLTEDFIYYWVHRMCHESETMWQFHRLHHTTKHPTALLLGYADEIQEVFDIVLAPAFAWLLYPIPFDVLVVWIVIHLSIQLHGHSGIRLYHGSVMTGPFLRPIGLDLISEDHDIHHRFGWGKSCNYGKQSGVWDTLFGTFGNRIECYEGNIDYSHRI